jgi:hypothetical protein
MFLNTEDRDQLMSSSLVPTALLNRGGRVVTNELVALRREFRNLGLKRSRDWSEITDREVRREVEANRARLAAEAEAEAKAAAPVVEPAPVVVVETTTAAMIAATVAAIAEPEPVIDPVVEPEVVVETATVVTAPVAKAEPEPVVAKTPPVQDECHWCTTCNKWHAVSELRVLCADTLRTRFGLARMLSSEDLLAIAVCPRSPGSLVTVDQALRVFNRLVLEENTRITRARQDLRRKLNLR